MTRNGKSIRLGRQCLFALSVCVLPVSVLADTDAVAVADMPTQQSVIRSFADNAVSTVMQFVRRSDESAPAALSPELRLEAFPALQASEDTLRVLDVSLEPVLMSRGLNATPGKQGLDLSSSYVWESPRFGQFVLSTNTSYLYNKVIPAVARENTVIGALGEGAGSSITLMPERSSSLTLSWQIGNHTATAVTSHSGALDQLGLLNLENMNADDLNELVGQMTTVDLSYGYNVRAGRQGNASISLGVRNMLDRRLQTPTVVRKNNVFEPAGSVAYGTIKYQF
jgi:hypothetical protein